MTSPRRSAPAVVAATLVALLLCACSATEPAEEPAYRETRKANLDSAMAEFDEGPFAEILCDVAGGQVSLNNGYDRVRLFRGANSWTPMIERLYDLNYSVDDYETSAQGNRSDGIRFIGRVILAPEAEPGIEEELAREGCVVPPEGASYVRFSEGDPGR